MNAPAQGVAYHQQASLYKPPFDPSPLERMVSELPRFLSYCELINSTTTGHRNKSSKSDAREPTTDPLAPVFFPRISRHRAPPLRAQPHSSATQATTPPDPSPPPNLSLQSPAMIQSTRRHSSSPPARPFPPTHPQAATKPPKSTISIPPS